MQDKNRHYTIGTLGPQYSYSEEAALGQFPDSKIVLFPNITETLQALKIGRIDVAVLPVENAINGPVSETWDELTAIKINSSSTIEILATFLLPIHHWIGVPQEVPESTTLDDVGAVFSHAQALYQSNAFLNTRLPQAEKMAVSSTSQSPKAAREHLKSTGIIAAAIANKTALISNNFTPIAPTISHDIANHTRFAVLADPKNKEGIFSLLPLNSPLTNSPPGPPVTAIAIHPGRDRRGLLLELLSIISEKHSCNLLSIHSRPDTKGGFVFYFELEGSTEDEAINVCINDLKQYCNLDTGNSAQLLYFGSYQRTSFGLQTLTKACVVGAKGAMGKWLVNFLQHAGLEVVRIDQDSTPSDKREITSCDLIVLSVPMKNIDAACTDLKKFIQEGALIVENCSVKARALSTISTHFPEPFETVGIHTMFGPDVTELKGKNIVISKTDNSGPSALALENLFYKFGANIHYADAAEHDRIVSALQALCQFASLGLGQVFFDNHADLESLTPFMTPNSARILTSIKRVISQSTGLTVDLQNENPYSKEIRAALIDALMTINSEIERPDLLEDRINTLRSKLGGMQAPS